MRGERSTPSSEAQCPAPEIESPSEAIIPYPLGAGPAQRIGDQFRAAIGEALGQVSVEFGRVIVEERPYISIGDRLAGRERPEPGEIDTHA
jgi:hypothetical protein